MNRMIFLSCRRQPQPDVTQLRELPFCTYTKRPFGEIYALLRDPETYADVDRLLQVVTELCGLAAVPGSCKRHIEHDQEPLVCLLRNIDRFERCVKPTMQFLAVLSGQRLVNLLLSLNVHTIALRCAAAHPLPCFKVLTDFAKIYGAEMLQDESFRELLAASFGQVQDLQILALGLKLFKTCLACLNEQTVVEHHHASSDDHAGAGIKRLVQQCVDLMMNGQITMDDIYSMILSVVTAYLCVVPTFPVAGFVVFLIKIFLDDDTSEFLQESIIQLMSVVSMGEQRRVLDNEMLVNRLLNILQVYFDKNECCRQSRDHARDNAKVWPHTSQYMLDTVSMLLSSMSFDPTLMQTLISSCLFRTELITVALRSNDVQVKQHFITIVENIINSTAAAEMNEPELYSTMVSITRQQLNRCSLNLVTTEDGASHIKRKQTTLLNSLISFWRTFHEFCNDQNPYFQEILECFSQYPNIAEASSFAKEFV